MVKHKKALAITLLLSLAMFAALGAAIVQAQGTATVAFLTSIGGTTDPTGTQTYADGTSVQISATPTDAGYVFTSFIILADSTTTTTTDNPTTLTVKGGSTYAVEAVFTPVQGIPGGNPVSASDIPNAAIIVILPSTGGSTTPAAGTYALANAAQTNISANPESGWAFSHWVITGSNMTGTAGHEPLNLEPTDNPYNVNHGYGATFYYQAVFTQTNAPSPTIPEIPGAMIAVLTVALVASVVASVVYRRRK